MKRVRPTIIIVTNPQIELNMDGQSAGSENVVIGDYLYLKKRGWNVKLVARSSSLKSKSSYILIQILKVAQAVPPLLKDVFCLLSELFYCLCFYDDFVKADVILTHSFSLIGLLFPKKTIFFIHNIEEKMYSWPVFSHRYEDMMVVFNSNFVQKKVYSLYSFLKRAQSFVVYPGPLTGKKARKIN
jgi:hypothetical protein